MAQEQLRDMWLHAQDGRLCAWEQAKALALREVSRELHGRTQLEWIAARVENMRLRVVCEEGVHDECGKTPPLPGVRNSCEGPVAGLG